MDSAALAVGLLHFALFSLVGCLVLQATRAHQETLQFQTRLLLWAFSLRFAASLLIYEGGLINTLKDEDASGWLVGAAYSRGWEQQGRSILDTPSLFLQAYETSNRGYYYMLGVVFLTTGMPGRLPAAALNGLVGALTVVFAYRVARSLFSEAVARRTAWLGCFFPSLIIWSAQTLKEPVVIFLETAALYGCIQLRQGSFSFRHLFLVSAAALLLYPFRFYAAYLAAGAVLVSLFMPQFGKGRMSLGPAVGVTLLLLAFVSLSGVQVTKELEQQQFDLAYLERFREGANIGQGSGVYIEADLHTPSGFGLALLVGAAHLLMAPFPWQWGGGLRIALVIPEVILWWVLLFYGVVPGLRHAIQNRFSDVLPLLLFLAGIGLLYSLMFSNIGLVYRQRAQLLPWLLIFAAVGIELRQRGRLARQSTSSHPVVGGSWQTNHIPGSTPTPVIS